MKKRFLAFLVTLLLLPTVSFAVGSREKVIVPSQIITDAAAVTVNVSASKHKSGYLVMVLSAETGTATMTVVAEVVGPLGEAFQICTPTAQTADGTYVFSMGVVTPAALEEISFICEAPLHRKTRFTFTVTGSTSPGFTVTASMLWHAN